MKEAIFIKQNKKNWDEYEAVLKQIHQHSPDKLAEIYINITNDLSFSQTHYPGSQLTQYLNNLASQTHQLIYKNKKEDRSRFITFWTREVPEAMAQSRRELLYSFLIFAFSIMIGAISAANDPTYLRLILGDSYVNMTEKNINKEDPMAVYKQVGEVDMFLKITINNVMVSFRVFAVGIFSAFVTGLMLFYNGVMLGSFQYFFYEQGLFLDSFLTIWIHGTLEISAIIIAGAAGLVMGNSFIFPGSYPRLTSFMKGAKRGLKIIVGLIPVFITAGFLEGFVTRHTEMPLVTKILIIAFSAFFITYYFVIFPFKIKNHARASDH